MDAPEPQPEPAPDLGPVTLTRLAVWLTRHGLGFLVDHTGSHRIHPEKARMILEAPAGVDIYPW